MFKSLLNRFRAVAAVAVGVGVLALSNPAAAQTWPVEGPFTVCEPTGNCERGNFAFNFEGEGVTVSLRVLGAVVNPETGRHEGRGTFEVRDGSGAQIVYDQFATFSIEVVPVAQPGGCGNTSAIASMIVNGEAVAAGKFFALTAVRGPESSPFGCIEAQLKGELSITQGKGALKKSWGEVKGSSR